MTGPFAKNQVNIEPTRLWHMVTPASLAAAATPATTSPASLSSFGVNIFVIAQVT